MKNLKIGKKLLVTFGAILVLFSVTILVSILSLQKADRNFETFYDNGYKITNQAIEMRRSIQTAIKNISYTMLLEDEAKTQEYIALADEEANKLAQGIAYMKQHFRGDMNLVTQAETYIAQGKEYRKQVTDLAAVNKNAEASAVFFDQYQPLMLKAQDLLIQINEVAGNNADTEYASAQRNQMMSTIFLIGIAVVTFIITIALAVYITKSLTRPILEIEQAATDMASGKMGVNVSYVSKDELGVLAQRIRTMTNSLQTIIQDEDYLLGEMAKGNFNISTDKTEVYVGDFQSILLSMRSIRDSLNETMMQINQSADQVNSGSEQVASGAQALSQGAAEQASSVETLAATINEISEQVRVNADNALDASKKAADTGEQMMQSNTQMQEMIKAMDEISNSSNEIGKIIKTIEDIAFQTNILALNAAVEAARAGAAGKGFAVVADEVRNLANKSQDASKNTATLIESSLKAVENGTRIADETAQSLLTAVEGAKIVTETVDKISEASKTQAKSIAQVTQGIEQISSVVQTNSATAEESAAASEELSGQAQMLRTLVGRFQLRIENALAGTPAQQLTSGAATALPEFAAAERY